MKPKSFAISVLFPILITSAFAADWAHWRGPAFNGSSPETNLPVDFSPTNNVKWVVGLPGPSAAMPIVSGGRVFISSTDLKTKTLWALAFDRKTGGELWRREIGPGFAKDNRSDYASPSPVTDGTNVFFLYGNGMLAAFKAGGDPLWNLSLEKQYGPLNYQWTYGASATLFDGRLLVPVLHRNTSARGGAASPTSADSYLLALNPSTGKELWRQLRTNNANAESQEAYTTPIPVEVNGVYQILIAGGDCITGHQASTGEELWRWGTWNPTRIGHWRLVTSPVSDGKLALAAAPKGAPIYAVKLGGKGNLSDDAIAWKSEDRAISSDVSTPAFYRGKFYVLNSDRKTIARLDPATGKADWIGQLDSRPKFESSPTVADGKLYFQNHEGEMFVVDAGDEFKVLYRVPMGDAGDRDTRASVAVSDGNLFIRTASKLYCVGK